MNPEFIKVIAFAAEKHKTQRRKDAQSSPYINHPIALANVLANEGEILAHDVLCAAVLHDTIEDTQTTAQELRELFGEKIASIVLEVTDDKSIKDKAVRKQLQVEHAPHISHEAKLVKLADKICNLRDILASPPANWDQERKLEYFQWAKKVIAGVRGTNVVLENIFDALVAEGNERFMRKKKAYTVESYDSYDSPDERKPLLQGEFDSYEEALAFSKEMVAKFIRKKINEGKSAQEAARSFCCGGADVPMILGRSDDDESFQPYDYADFIAAELASKR